MNKKYDMLPGLFWICLSLFIMAGSYKLGLEDFHNPGAGLMPFLLGGALFLVSIPLVVKSLSKREARNTPGEATLSGKINAWKVGSVSGSLLAYALLLEKLGFLITTTLLFVFLFKVAGSSKWRTVLAASVFTVIISYLVFTSLGLRFPKGIWKVG